MPINRKLPRFAPVLLLLLPACAKAPPQPIPVVAEARQCPAFPAPPAELMEPPAKTDFLTPIA